ncbi:UNVERIFIED_CONTAM: hypothetical protein RKD43_006076 [Streptomyces graminofaciens]
MHAHHRQGADGALQIGRDGADGVLHVFGGGPDAPQKRGDDDGGGRHRQGDKDQQQRIDPQHEEDRACRDECAGDQVDQCLSHHFPQEGGVGRRTGDEVTAAMSLVLPHLQPEQPRDEAVAKSSHHAFPHAFQDEAPDGAGGGLEDEQAAQQHQQRPDRPAVRAGVHDLFGDERLGQPEGRAAEGEDGGDDDGRPVCGGEPVHGGDGGPGGPVTTVRPPSVAAGTGCRPGRAVRRVRRTVRVRGRPGRVRSAARIRIGVGGGVRVGDDRFHRLRLRAGATAMRRVK